MVSTNMRTGPTLVPTARSRALRASCRDSTRILLRRGSASQDSNDTEGPPGNEGIRSGRFLLSEFRWDEAAPQLLLAQLLK